MLSLAMTVMSFTAFSQTIQPRQLQPTVQLIETDTTFCFTLGQSRVIAQILQRAIMQDSMLIAYQRQVQNLQWLTENQKLQITNQGGQITNQSMLLANRAEQNRLLLEDLNFQQQEVSRHKKHKKWMGIGLGLLAILAAVR